jgi:hypothetical protein
VRTIDGGADVGFCTLGGFTAFFGLAASAQAGLTQLDETVRCAAGQSLCIGVGTNELNALDIALDHVLNSVTAAATDTDHFDLGALVEFFSLDHFNGHGALLNICSCLNFVNLVFEKKGLSFVNIDKVSIWVGCLGP